MEGKRAKSHLRLVYSDRELDSLSDEQTDFERLPELWEQAIHELYESLLADLAREPGQSQVFVVREALRLPVIDWPEESLLSAECSTQIHTSDGEMTPEVFLSGIRSGAEIHVQRDTIVLCLMTLVAQREAFYAEPLDGGWWSLSGLV